MITYGSTTLTSYNSIVNTEVYYYKSTSPTALSGGSWSTTKPTWESGKYVWQKIRTIYEDETYTESDPVNITGQQGATGNAAYSYKLNASDTTVTVSKDGTYSKTSVTFSATSKQGTGAVGVYAGRFKIETTANGTTWTTQYTSSVNESSKNYTIPTGILNIRCSLYQAGGTSVLLDIVSVAIVTDGKDGTNGTNGLNNARVILYRRFNAAPSGTDIAPTGNVTYTFSTGVAVNNLNSWTQNIPTGTNPVYMIAASASNTGATDTIAKTEWSAPIKILENGQNGTNGTNGTNGIDGYNQATIYLYQRKSGTAPSKPSSAVTYTFSTGALSSVPTGWSRTIPTNNGNPCYVTTATAVAKTTTYSIPASGWSDVVVLSQDGENGKDGIDGTSQNLLLDVYASSLTKVKAPWDRYLSDTGNTTITGEFIAESNLPDPNATHFYRITDSSASTKGRGLCFYNGGIPPLFNGHTYRIGCWVRNHSGKPRLYICLGSVGEWLPHKTIENTQWEWIECVRTFGDTDPTINGQSSTYKRIYFYLSNNNVAGSSLDMCGFKIEEVQTNISTARNYLLKTEKLEGWGVTGGATISNGVATFPEVTANTWREIYPTKNFKYEAIRNKNIIFSVRVKTDVGKICACNLCIGVDATETAYVRQKYKNNFVYFTGDDEWHTICTAMPISDELFTGGSGTPDYDNCWVTVRIGAVNSYHNSFQVKEPQFSLGTTATAWSAAPEDVEQEISTLRTDLQSQIDEKIQTYYQSTNPASSWTTAEARAPHDGDLWYYTGTSTSTYTKDNVYRYNASNNTWSVYSASGELFDKIDGKTAIYYGTQSSITSAEEGDYLVDSTDGSSYRWNNGAWVKVTDYKTAINNIQIGGRNLLCNSNQSLTTVSSKGDFHLSETIPTGTTVITSVQIDADDITWVSSGYRRIGFEISQSSDGIATGTQYVGVWWGKSGTTNNGADINYNTSSTGVTSYHGRIWSKATLTRPFLADIKRGGIYVQGITSGTYKISNPKVEIATKPSDWTPAPEDTQADIDTALAQSVEYIIGTQTAATGTWTGKSSTLTELKDGTQIRYWLPYAGSGNATLNLTLKDGTTTGAIPIYRQGGSASSAGVVTANRVTTHFPAGTSISMVYGINRIVSAVYSNTTYTGTFTGWFTDGAYDSGNTINRTRLQNAITAETAITAGRIICGTATGYKNIGAGIHFDLSYPILYANSAIAATNTGDNNYLQINGVSASNNGTIQSGTAKKILYLKGTILDNTFTISASPFMTTVVPTSADGFYYIPLGMMYSATAIYFTSSNRLYAYLDSAFQPVDTAAILRAAEAKKTATNYMSSDNTGVMVADLIDGEQLPANATGKNVFITTGYGSGDVAVDAGVHIRDGQTDLANFGETARIGKKTGGNVYIDSDSVDVNDGDITYASFGPTTTIGNNCKISMTGDTFAMANSRERDMFRFKTSNSNNGYAYASVFLQADGIKTIFYSIYNIAFIRDCYYRDDETEKIPFPVIDTEDTTKMIFDSPPNRECIVEYATLDNLYQATLGTRYSGDTPDHGAYGTRSVAIGNSNNAYGAESIAIGSRNNINNNFNMTLGYYLNADIYSETKNVGKAQLVLGRYNEQKSANDYSFIIGNGTSQTARNNAFAITTSNEIQISLDITASSGTVDADLYDAIRALGWQNDVIE